MSMRISTAQASTKPAPRIFLDLRLRHFPWQLSHKMSLVTCRCAFRLGKLAQNGCRSLGLRHFTSESRVKWFLRSVHFHFDCAGSHKTVVAVLVCGIFPENSRVNGSCDMSMCISTAQARAKSAARVFLDHTCSILFVPPFFLSCRFTSSEFEIKKDYSAHVKRFITWIYMHKIWAIDYRLYNIHIRWPSALGWGQWILLFGPWRM
jgi:hypothetical protein